MSESVVLSAMKLTFVFLILLLVASIDLKKTINVRFHHKLFDFKLSHY
jgi:hypothetical protein